MAGQRRMVVVGGDAAGMSAASRARRLRDREQLAITAFERGRFTSYSACGIPYWTGGVVDGPEALVARTPEAHRERGIDVRMVTEVTELDVDGQRVRARDLTSGQESWHGFDDLVLATGARPVRPPLEGIEARGVYGVQNLEDGRALLEGLERTAGRRAVVIGAGYIGVEMAEALVRRGCAVTVVERSAQPMATLDPDMGALVREAMCGMGIEVVTDTSVTGIHTGADGEAVGVATEAGDVPADVVVLGLGVRPETSLAAAAGLPLGESGGLLTDLAMRVRGQGNIWAGGDCVEVLDLVSGRTRHIALGTHANKHGQVIGTNVGGGYATFPGVVGTAVSKVCDLEIARTGLREKDARAVGLRFVTATIESTSRAGYYPDARPMTVKMLAERGTGRLLGVQIVGREGAAKRVDVAAVALTARMTVEQMTALDLGYAPPFSPVWDPVLVAARKAATAIR
ncbi:FAD-dependent oxidoreductase [Streptomyces griseocarneus]|uniref:FAD-dependent oxidoreductase n=1 Tax=Streptomyces griseocarneus TaxID=51201 RepID=UPI00167CFA60|nr:FAD-dependent oxidoreductase [Streptomyces griseocarneus]MBZ6472584.1 FAD-dependent oxidoreductase [Streptomyces griseocarneus]GHG46092.1 flavoprotein oxidoreductase [Streptomyces griseocarneus]